jgi:hypothetical protein
MGLFKEMIRISSVGYIETPSPAGEIVHHNNLPYLGSIHHRFMLWTNPVDNSLNILPKYSFLEYLQQTHQFQAIYSEAVNILQTQRVNWNNYYVWSSSDSLHLPKMILHQHEVGSYDLRDPESYLRIIQRGIQESKIATELFLQTNQISVQEYEQS